MAYIFNGKQFAQQKEEEIRKKVSSLKLQGVTPKLAVILVGEDPGSKLYVSLKQKAAERVGVETILLQPVEATQKDIVELIEQCNADFSIHGILLQLPLPDELNSKDVVERIVKIIDLKKDVDGLRQDSPYIPATVKAILYVIEQSKHSKSKPKFKIGCVVGGTGEVGSRLVKRLNKYCENISIINTKSENPQEISMKADLLVSVVGIPGLVTKDWIKPGAVVIDVGSPKGDVAEEVRDIASFITPVPGGIGPMTVACLLENTTEAAEMQTK